MVKYSGRFVVEDKANDKKYLADLIYGWDVGDNLTGWALAGSTHPTIAANGRIDLYCTNPAGAAWTWGKYTLPNTLGDWQVVISMKLRCMPDNTTTSIWGGRFGILWDAVLQSGIEIFDRATNMSLTWTNEITLGVRVDTIIPFVPGTEYLLAIIKGKTEILYILDGVLIGRIQLSNKGSCIMSLTQLQSFCANNKKVNLYSDHIGAGQVSHWQVRDIKVGRLVGVSSL